MGEKRIYPEKKENEEGVDGFIWSSELANCLTIEERISRRIRAVGRIANSAVASLSRSSWTSPLFPSVFVSLRPPKFQTHAHSYKRIHMKYIHSWTHAFHAHFHVSQDPRSTDPYSRITQPDEISCGFLFLYSDFLFLFLSLSFRLNGTRRNRESVAAVGLDVRFERAEGKGKRWERKT